MRLLFLPWMALNRRRSSAGGIRLFHATQIDNVPGILKHGLKKHLDGIYLSDSIKGAAQWKVARMQTGSVAVIEVEVDGRTIRDGIDHSPAMQTLFKAGRSFLSPKNIPSKFIPKIHFRAVSKSAKT